MINEPRPEEVEMLARDACQECQRKQHGQTPDEALEMLVQAQETTRRHRVRKGSFDA